MSKKKDNTADLNDQMIVRREKLQDLKSEGKDPFEETKYPQSHLSSEIKANYDELEEEKVYIAGRIIAKRGMGKAGFADIQDSAGQIQIYIRQDEVGKEAYALWKKLDIGDIVGIHGFVNKTNTGEITVHVEDYELLAKCLRPLPEKWSGLQDPELRFRQRYLDLLMNDGVKDKFVMRSKIISHLRSILEDKGFIEVETPILNTIPGGANARPFVTHHNTLDIDMYMRIAPELYLKRLVVGGFDKVFELGRNFRNEGMDHKHNPEFTMLELYEAYSDYEDMMDLTEELIKRLAKEVIGKTEFEFEGHTIDLGQDFERLTMLDAVKKYAGVDFTKVEDLDEAFKLAKEHNVETQEVFEMGDILNAFFETFVEENLIQPTFVYDYPIEVSPLSKQKPSNPKFTERFELFIDGEEFANAYSELNDPIEQEKRFKAQESRRAAGDDEAQRIDEDYLIALQYALPPTGGLGIGIDRLVMLLTEEENIREVILFPTMKPTNTESTDDEE